MRSPIAISACLVLALPALAQSTALNSGPAPAARKPAHEAAAGLRAALLSAQAQFMDSSGRVDYRRLERSPEWARCREQARALQNISLAELSDRASRMAFWANTYNAMVLDGIMSLRIKRSVLEVRDFFQQVRYLVGGYEFSLNDIEHGILRGNRPPKKAAPAPFTDSDPRLAFRIHPMDPRIHFALNCGARSCPAIRAYEPHALDEQLDLAARSFINGPDVRVDRARGRIALSQIFEWYAEDFGTTRAEVVRFVGRYLDDAGLAQYVRENADRLTVEYLRYDWSLNRT